MMTKAGIVARLKIKVAATASSTACPIVARRAVATAARITAVDPCGHALRIQNQPTRTTARAARNPVHSAATGSLAGRKGGGRGNEVFLETQGLFASPQGGTAPEKPRR